MSSPFRLCSLFTITFVCVKGWRLKVKKQCILMYHRDSNNYRQFQQISACSKTVWTAKPQHVEQGPFQFLTSVISISYLLKVITPSVHCIFVILSAEKDDLAYPGTVVDSCSIAQLYIGQSYRKANWDGTEMFTNLWTIVVLCTHRGINTPSLHSIIFTLWCEVLVQNRTATRLKTTFLISQRNVSLPS
jgi:hypothetical protein